jgi:hypothetical protein
LFHLKVAISPSRWPESGRVPNDCTISAGSLELRFQIVVHRVCGDVAKQGISESDDILFCDLRDRFVRPLTKEPQKFLTRKQAAERRNKMPEAKPSKPRRLTAKRSRNVDVLFRLMAFYEWRTIGGTKIPFAIAMKDDRPFAFAGLWEGGGKIRLTAVVALCGLDGYVVCQRRRACSSTSGLICP